MPVRPTIYCDMDGVLCNFFAAIQNLSDQPIQSLSVSQMWALCRTQRNFWRDLEWTEDGRELWRVVDYYSGHILSSLPYSDPNSEPGKRKWLQKNIQLTDSGRIHLVTPRKTKQNYAVLNGVTNVLIDDYTRNTDEWRAAGGIAILHTSTNNTLRQLRDLGFEPDSIEISEN